MANSRIYFDHAATTPVHPLALDAMHCAAKDVFGNPSSVHAEGRAAKSFVEECRKKIALRLNAGIGEIFFTSGGTESNNTVLYQAVKALGVKTIISSPIEHPNVLNPIAELEKEGLIACIMLPVNTFGQIDLDHLENLLFSQKNKTLVSIMHVHNELGTAYPIEEIASLCNKYHCLFHCDTVQGIGFHYYDLQQWRADFISGSAHKFYGPKGVGFMFVRQGHLWPSWLKGGSQERNMRPGTENIIGIAGMTASIEWCYANLENRIRHLTHIKEYMINKLKLNFPTITFNTPISQGDAFKNQPLSSPKILNVHFPPFEGSDLLQIMFDIESIAVSGGSACSTGVEKASHVISHIRPNDEGKAIRFSFGYQSTTEECDRVILAMQKILKKGR